MLNPGRLGELQYSEGDQSLAELLESPFCHVRPSLEQVGESWCSVVDLVNDPSRGPRLTVWIDAQRGYLPVRQVWYDKRTRQSVLMEFCMDDLHQLAGGIWLPTLAHGSHGSDAWELRVDRDANGAFAMAVNEPVDEALFNLGDQLPPGSRAVNIRTNQHWTVAGRDHNAAADPIVTVPANHRNGIPIQATVADFSASTKAAPSISILAVMAGCVLAFVPPPLLRVRSRR